MTDNSGKAPGFKTLEEFNCSKFVVTLAIDAAVEIFSILPAIGLFLLGDGAPPELTGSVTAALSCCSLRCWSCHSGSKTLLGVEPMSWDRAK